MRVFIDSLNYTILQQLITTDKKYTRTIIYTPSGILMEESSRYYILIPDDVECKYVTYQKVDMIIDSSSFIRKEEVFTMPSERYTMELHEDYYPLTSDICIVTQSVKGKTIDIHFMSDTKNELSIVQSVYDIIKGIL